MDVKTAFSCIERLFGGYVIAKKWFNMIKEMI
jgi:hypothetical protein